MVDTESLFGDPEATFPIETAEKELFFQSSLKHKDANELNMYNCGVRFGELKEWPAKTLLLSPVIETGDESLDDAQEALTHAAGVVLNYLIEANIPHNILIADEGMTMYIIPRKFDMLLEGDVNFYTSFETLCGFIKYKTSSGFENSNGQEIEQIISSQISYNEQEWDGFKEAVMKKFETEYECNRI
jgi:hypothetical protein